MPELGCAMQANASARPPGSNVNASRHPPRFRIAPDRPRKDVESRQAARRSRLGAATENENSYPLSLNDVPLFRHGSPSLTLVAISVNSTQSSLASLNVHQSDTDVAHHNADPRGRPNANALNEFQVLEVGHSHGAMRPLLSAGSVSGSVLAFARNGPRPTWSVPAGCGGRPQALP